MLWQDEFFKEIFKRFKKIFKSKDLLILYDAQLQFSTALLALVIKRDYLSLDQQIDVVIAFWTLCFSANSRLELEDFDMV